MRRIDSVEETDFIKMVAKRGYVLQSGTVVFSDTAEHLSTNEMVRKVYLGEM